MCIGLIIFQVTVSIYGLSDWIHWEQYGWGAQVEIEQENDS
jgi:hypothetical protein